MQNLMTLSLLGTALVLCLKLFVEQVIEHVLIKRELRKHLKHSHKI